MNEPLIPNVPFLPREPKDADDLLRWAKETQAALRENHRIVQKRLEELNLVGSSVSRPSAIGARRLYWNEATGQLENDPHGVWQTVGDPRPAIAHGRLTLLSGGPVPTADQSAKGTVYYAPYIGNKITLLDPTNKNLLHVSAADILSDRGNFYASWSALAGATRAIVTTSPWHGSSCMSATTPGAVTPEGIYANLQFEASAGTTYTASVYVRGAGNLQLYVGYYTSAGALVAYSAATTFTAGTNWVRVVNSSLAPATTAYAAMFVATNGIQAVTFYVDGAQIETGQSATEWVPGREWKTITFSEKSLAIAAAVGGLCYDVWGSIVNGTLSLSMDAWTSGTARVLAPSRVDGVWVHGRNYAKRYLGTFYCYSNGLTSDAQATRYLFNCDNRVSRRLYMPDGTAGHNYSGAWRYWNNNGYPFHYVDGLTETVLSASINGQLFLDAAAGNGWLGLGPAGAAPVAFFDVPLFAGGIVNSAHMTYQSTLGLNTIYAWEGNTANTLFDWETLFGSAVI